MELESRIIELPKFYFARCFNEAEKEYLTEHIATLPISLPVTPLPQSKKNQVIASALIANQEDWLQTALQLSVKTREPRIDDVYFLSPEQTTVLRRLWNKPESWMGGGFNTGHVVLMGDGEAKHTVSILNHELFHTIAQSTYGLLCEKVQLQSCGYENVRNGVCNGLSELVTELLSIESLDHYRRRGGTNCLEGIQMGYHSQTIFLDMLLDKVTHCVQQDVRNELFRGYFTANMAALRVFEILGKGSLRHLASYPADASWTTTEVYANYLGVDSYALRKKINAYESGETIQIHGIQLSR